MSIAPFEPGASLARISAGTMGWRLDCRGPHAARHYDVASVGEAAELAVLLRDQGGWSLRYSPAAHAVQKVVDELTDGGAQ